MFRNRKLKKFSGGTTRRELLTGAGGAIVGAVIATSGSQEANAELACSGPPIKIGSSVPLTGWGSGDGEDMMRGFELAVDEINASGGICGRPVEHVALDAGEFAPDVMVNNFKRLITEFEVHAIIGGYQTNTGPEFDLMSDAEMIYIHNNTVELNAEAVRNNKEKYWMIFQHDPTERWYSLSLPGVLETLEASGAWKPINYNIVIVNANNSYSAGLTKHLKERIKGSKWNISMIEEIVVPLTEWGPTLAKIRANPPSVIWVTDYFPGDLASFTKQFALDPTPSLLHEQYGPSVPEYLDLAGSAANGVMWASVIGVIQDEIGNTYNERYRERFGEEPGLSQGGATYDATHIYWQAAALSGGDVENRRKIADMLRALSWRGVCGARKFDPDDQTARPYPHHTKDAALAMPTQYYQIQNKQHVVIDPAPFTTGEFQLPPWFA